VGRGKEWDCPVAGRFLSRSQNAHARLFTGAVGGKLLSIDQEKRKKGGSRWVKFSESLGGITCHSKHSETGKGRVCVVVTSELDKRRAKEHHQGFEREGHIATKKKNPSARNGRGVAGPGGGYTCGGKKKHRKENQGARSSRWGGKKGEVIQGTQKDCSLAWGGKKVLKVLWKTHSGSICWGSCGGGPKGKNATCQAWVHLQQTDPFWGAKKGVGGPQKQGYQEKEKI